MKKHYGLFSQYAIGVLFGWGLIISGMSNPQKILGFLDLAGNWDPSLMFVMLGAVLVGLAGFYIVSKRSEAFFGDALHIPTRRDITKPLIIGSLIFGAGWGIAGFCPGPALVALGAGHLKALVFVLAMLVGMEICERFFTGHRNKPKQA
ncbi:YeeE/YedE family protein [Polynucleobacter sp. MWH-Berg-3C6]|uniref:YeeE/YedE family protein n=1 Tax=Polynucleobacter sp. MWH-Berg-3C6 TaxID=1855882 RepID=UPI0021045452|nr:YeeE/YedE family protein [Polynucleobacter sp. MWH-Berg-3C6]